MDRVVDDLRLRTREANAKTKRFVSDSEWLSIDQVLVSLRAPLIAVAVVASATSAMVVASGLI